jgi:hypothetical protein
MFFAKESMIIKVMVIDEDNGIVNGDVGRIPAKDLIEFIKQAEMYNLPCLQFIDISGDTIFSNMQMSQIRDELFELKCDPTVNRDIIAIIERGTDEALLENFDYLKFEGL